MSVAVEPWRLLEAWDPARHPRGPNGRFISTGGAARRAILTEHSAGRIDSPEAARRLRALAEEHGSGSAPHAGLTAAHIRSLADAIHVEVAAPVKPTASPSRMTKGEYTKLLKAEHVRLQILAGMSEREAKAAARPAATIDQLKARNAALRQQLRAQGIDHRTEEQRNTDDAAKAALLDEVEQLAAAGGHDGPAKRAAAARMSVPELRKFVADAKAYQARQAQKQRWAAESAAVRRDRERERASRPAQPRQVDYILGLLRNHAGGGFFVGPTDRAGISRLTQQEASAYIDSLTDNY
jgi:hypothetical protein